MKVVVNIVLILAAAFLLYFLGKSIQDTGQVEPQGRLPVSFPARTGQCPLSYRRFATGRPAKLTDNSVWWSHYEDAPNEALYPFGYGLGYTEWTFGAPSLAPGDRERGVFVCVSCTVTNAGNRAGSTVVQLYVNDPVATRARPMRELRAWQRVDLAPGESRSVKFEVTETTLQYWTPEEDWHVEPGAYHLMTGPHSADLKAVTWVMERA